MVPRRLPVFYGWVIVVLSTVGICASMPGQTMGVSVFTTRLTEALGLSAMQLSVAYMIGTLLSATGLSKGGRYFDAAGARKAIVLSLASLGVVLIGLSFVDRIAMTVRQWGLFGAMEWLAPFVVITLGFGLLRFTGQGMVTLSSRAMLGKWFDKRRGTVTAVSGAIVSFAFSGAPIALEYMIRGFGWQGAWRVMGLFMLLGLAVLFWVFARDNPEECGLEMDGGFVGKARKENLDAVIYRDFSKEEAQRTFAFWAFTLTFALQSLVGTAYAFHVIAVGEELAVGRDYILGLFVPSAAVAVVTGFAVAWLSDLSFVRVKYLLLAMGLGGFLGFGALGAGDYPEVGWLHAIGFGISGGCFGSLSTIVYPRFFGRSHLGAINGMFMTMIVVASAVGPFFFSWCESAFGSYRAGFVLSAVVAAGLAVAALRADNPQRKVPPAGGGGR